MADFKVIPQEAADYLLANPSAASAFDTKYGEGKSQEILIENEKLPTQEVAQEEDQEAEWSVIGEATRAVVGGVREAVQETGNFADWVGDSVADKVWGEGNDIYWTDNGFEVLPRSEGGDAPILGDGGLIDLPEVAPNKTMVGGFGRGVSQFLTGFGAFSKMTKIKGVYGAFVNGALTDAIVFNPDDPNVTAILEDFGIDAGPVKEVLATDPDDPEWMNRLRNTAEGAVAGGIVEILGLGVRALKARKAGDTVKAAKLADEQMKALGLLDDEIAKAADEVKLDVDETIKVEKDLFGDPEVQLKQSEMDLGDTPLAPKDPEVKGKGKRPITITPEQAENVRLQASLAKGATLPQKLSDLSQRAVRTQESFEHVSDLMGASAHVLKAEFDKIKGGDVQRWATVRIQSAAMIRMFAEQTGKSMNEVVQSFGDIGKGDPTKLAAAIHTKGRIVLTLSEEIKGMANVIGDHAAGKPFDLRPYGVETIQELKLLFIKQQELGATLMAGHNADVSNLGRALHAVKMAKKSHEGLRQAILDPEAFKNVDAMAAAVRDPANAGKGVFRTLDDAAKAVHGFMDEVNGLRIQAMLSGPGTQEVNIISNALQALYVPTGQAVGGIVSGNPKAVSHALRQYKGSVAGLLDFARATAKAGWDNKPILDAKNNKVDEQAFMEAVSTTGKIIRMPSRFLMTMDEFFKQSMYRGRVFADASEEAIEKGLRGQTKKDYIDQYIRDSYDEMGAAMREDALLQAQRATFTEPLEEGLGAILQTAAIKSPVVRFIVPFVRTPVNILSQTAQHVPVFGVAISKRFRADITAGGIRRTQALGRQAVGAGIATWAAMTAAQGTITGSGPRDPRVRKAWLKNNQPYSFVVAKEDGTKEFISYARLEPLANILSISADLWELYNDDYNEAERIGVGTGLALAILENTVNKTFTQGISDAMDAVNGDPRTQQRAVRNFVSSFVPNLYNQTNGDDAMREVRTMVDALMVKTHLYNKVDPQRNQLGEVILRRLPKYDPLGLTEADIREHDPVMAEITKWGIMNDTVVGMPARKIKGPNKVDLTTVRYSDTQSYYDRWMELVGTVKINGKTLREKLEADFKSDKYKHQIPDGAPGVRTGTKPAYITKIIGVYRKKAKAEFPELRELIISEEKGGNQLLRKQVTEARPFLFEPTATTQGSK